MKRENIGWVIPMIVSSIFSIITIWITLYPDKIKIQMSSNIIIMAFCLTIMVSAIIAVRNYVSAKIKESNLKLKAQTDLYDKHFKDDYEILCYLATKLKFYDAVYNKYLAEVQSGIYSLKVDDVELFNDEERQYLNQHIKALEDLYIIQRGRNKTFGAFQKPFQ